MKILDLYTSLLKVAGMTTTSDGFVSYKIGDDTKPATIQKKRLVLPTDQNLANSAKSEIIIFHPLSENLLREESVVMERYRTDVSINLNLKISELAHELLQIATSPATHANLNPDQLEFLSLVKNADEKTMAAFQKVVTAMGEDKYKKKSFISLYLKRGGHIGSKGYLRVCVVNFPVFAELKKDGNELYGVKLRVKDKETITNLLAYIFPRIGEAEAFNRGSDCNVAASLDALMKGVLGIASHINDKATMFSNQIENSADLMINDEWVDTFTNLEVMVPQIRMIPMQNGNEGTVKNLPTQTAPATVVQPTGDVAQPVQVAQPQVAGKKFDPLPPFIANGAYPNPGAQFYPQQQSFYPQQQMYQPPQPVVGPRGMSFDSLLRMNPGLGMGGSQMPPQPMYQQPMQQPMMGYQQPAMGGYRTLNV